MNIETITEQAELVIWKMSLLPGESSHWHTDNCRRFTVIVSGDKLAIEYWDDAEALEIRVEPGTTGWDEPENKVHRATNVGQESYIEVVSFYRANAEVVPQPSHP